MNFLLLSGLFLNKLFPTMNLLSWCSSCFDAVLVFLVCFDLLMSSVVVIVNLFQEKYFHPGSASLFHSFTQKKKNLQVGCILSFPQFTCPSVCLLVILEESEKLGGILNL